MQARLEGGPASFAGNLFSFVLLQPLPAVSRLVVYIHSRLDVMAEDVEVEAGAAVLYGQGFQLYAVGYQLPGQENGGGAVEDVIAGISCISVAGQKTDIWYFSLCLSAGFSLAQ